MIDINEKELTNTALMCNSTHSIIVEDIKNFKALADKISTNAMELGKFDGLAHVAGIPYICPLKVLNSEKALEVFQINTLAAVELTKIFNNKSVYAGSQGSIVFVSSVYGVVGSSSNVAYSMSKSGLIGATKSLAIELAPKKIRVNCVAPGFIKTQMKENTDVLFDEGHDQMLMNMHPLGLGEAIDVANGIAFLMSDAAKWITGAVLNIDGGFTAQ